MTEQGSAGDTLDGLIAEQVRVLLARRKMRPTDLAELAGMPRQRLHRKLNGATWTAADLLAVAVGLDVAIEDLYPPATRDRLQIAAAARNGRMPATAGPAA